MTKNIEVSVPPTDGREAVARQRAAAQGFRVIRVVKSLQVCRHGGDGWSCNKRENADAPCPLWPGGNFLFILEVAS